MMCNGALRTTLTHFKNFTLEKKGILVILELTSFLGFRSHLTIEYLKLKLI